MTGHEQRPASRSKLSLGIVSVVAALGLMIVAFAWFSMSRNEAALAEQLRLAWKEGLPTNGDQFQSLLPKVAPADNAAPIYGKLKLNKNDKRSPVTQYIDDLTWKPSQNKMDEAQQLLHLNESNLDLLEQASLRPYCQFDVDWSLGPLLQIPESYELVNAVLLVLMKGSLAAANADPQTAIKCTRLAWKAIDHLKQTPGFSTQLTALMLVKRTGRALGNWALKYRNVPEYRQELTRLLTDWKLPDAKWLHRYDLVVVLETLRLYETKAGRAELGFSDPELKPVERFQQALRSRSKAKVAIVKVMRDMWAALDAPQQKREQLMKRAGAAMMRESEAFPEIAGLFSKYDSGLVAHTFIAIAESDKLLFRTALRALASPKIPTTLDTSDLLSPGDGTPVNYTFDGAEIVIEANAQSSGAGVVRLRIGPRRKVVP